MNRMAFILTSITLLQNMYAQSIDLASTIIIGFEDSPTEPGTIRWNPNTQDFEGYDGTSWVSFTSDNRDSIKQFGQEKVCENHKILPPQYSYKHHFGFAIDLEKTTAVMGAHGKGPEGFSSGEAFIYEKTASSWKISDTLSHTMGEVNDRFGNTVEIDSNFLVIGAPNIESAYIYEKKTNGWEEDQKLNAPIPGSTYFGETVTIAYPYAAIGAPKDNANEGALYLYKHISNNWSLDTDCIVIGEVSNTYGKGHIYQTNSAGWKRAQTVTSAISGFGLPVAIEDGYILIAAPRDDDLKPYVGSILEFRIN